MNQVLQSIQEHKDVDITTLDHLTRAFEEDSIVDHLQEHLHVYLSTTSTHDNKGISKTKNGVRHANSATTLPLHSTSSLSDAAALTAVAMLARANTERAEQLLLHLAFEKHNVVSRSFLSWWLPGGACGPPRR